jgi:hypothetical protein
MAFRFNNPLRRVANTQTAINRGIGQFGQVSQALTEFNDVQKSIGRVSSSIGQISSNASSLSGTITNISSAGDVLNSLGGNSSLQNTFRSVSALTRDVQSLIPGNSRVASQATTLSKRAEDLFANTQRNIQGIQSITGGVTDVLNGTLDVGNLANRSLGPLTGGLNLGQLTNGLSGITGSNGLTRNLASGLQSSLGSFGGGQISSSVTDAISNITSSAPELSNIVNNPISVVPKSIAELTNPIGERYDGIKEQYERLSSVTTFDNYVNNAFQPLTQVPLGQFEAFQQRAFGGPNSGAGNSYSRVANPLRNYSSFNYIVTLGILDADEYNSPSVYRSAGGFKKYIIKSGGGNYSKRYQVDAEFNNNDPGDAEYFIDNLEIDAAIAPNPNTHVALGTSLTFTVQEPYSMGNFIEAIIGASAAAGFNNYLDAPFCLRIDFVGWDEYGDKTESLSLVNPIFLPIKFTKMDLNVDGKGSVYEVKAVPMSESALGDDINEVKTPINANGDFVHTVLETGARSVSNIMNSRVQALEDSDVVAPYDRYAIIFPNSRQEFRDYLEQDIINEDALRIDVEDRIRDAIGGEVTRETATEAARLRRSYEQQNENIINATVNSVGRTYAKIKTFAEDVNAMNAIGTSVLVDEIGTGGNQAHGSQAAANIDDQRAARNSAELAPAERSRDYQFTQGMTITEIIERMVVSSEYARERANEPAQNGVRQWFKIDTYTFIEENPLTEAQIGRPPKVYVYSVIPYDADDAKFLAPSDRAQNTEGLKAAAAKEYNYIYTGKNEDVLDFNISFNNAFMQTSFANFGQNGAGIAAGEASSLTQRRDRITGSRVTTNSGNDGNTGVTGQTREAVTFDSAGFGDAVQSGDIRRRITEMLHDRMVNQTIDMVTAEMEIFGDPFYIPQEMGNFVSEPGNSPNMSQEGTMRYQESEVFTVVNFKTPYDYQVEGATMEFPQTVAQFSGLFSVWAVTNIFNGGKFTQRLKLIRRRGQDDPPTENSGGAGGIEASSETSITDVESTGDTQTGNTNSNAGAGSGNTPSTPNPHASSTPSVNTAPTTARSPEGVRFGSMDQALNAARAYQQANPGYNYAVRQGDNGGWTIGPRPSTQPTNTTTSPDLSNQVQGGTQVQPPSSPAC